MIFFKVAFIMRKFEKWKRKFVKIFIFFNWQNDSISKPEKNEQKSRYRQLKSNNVFGCCCFFFYER